MSTTKLHQASEHNFGLSATGGKQTIVRPNFEISRASPAAIASMALVKPAVGSILRLPLQFWHWILRRSSGWFSRLPPLSPDSPIL